MNRPITISIGFVNSPASANRKAAPWPIRAAIRVASAWFMRMARTARSTRPPSIGKAGMRLNTTRKMLAAASRARRPARGFSISVMAAPSKPVPTRRISTAAITTFTAGPAGATTSSSPGVWGKRRPAVARPDGGDHPRRDPPFHGGPGERNDGPPRGLVGNALRARHPADGPERHVRRADPVASGRDDVPELMGEHAGEEEHDEEHA